jgi:hypothetical protein
VLRKSILERVEKEEKKEFSNISNDADAIIE